MSRTEQAGNYILGRMQNEMKEYMYYHNVAHVLDVLQAVEFIAGSEKVTPQEMELLKVAALFHDAGFIRSTENHEKLSCDIAREYLPGVGFSNDEIENICTLIMATCIPQSPGNNLEKIICDADLDYLGRDDFFTIGYKMYQEFKARNLISGEREWNELQVKFLSAHKYFTNTSVSRRSDKKEEHLRAIRQVLQQTV